MGIDIPLLQKQKQQKQKETKMPPN